MDVVRDATGAIKQVLWIMHGTTPQSIGVSGSLNSSPISLGALNGNGVNETSGSGRFASLAVVPEADGSYVWVYLDAGNIMAVNTNGIAAPVTEFVIKDSDQLNLPVLVDNTNVLLATTDPHNQVQPPTNPPQYTCQLIRISTSTTLAANSGIVFLNEPTTGSGSILPGNPPIGLSLVGISGSYLVYFNNGSTNGSGPVALEAIPKTSTSGGSSTLYTATMPAQQFTASPVAVSSLSNGVLSSGVYYSVAGGSPSTQVYFYDFVSMANSPIGGVNGNALLGGVLANPAGQPPSANPAYASVIVAELTTSTSYSGATIIGFDSTGFNRTLVGTLPNFGYTGIALSDAPLQSGIPALLEVSGQQASGTNATDLFVITPGTSASLKQVTNNLQ